MSEEYHYIIVDDPGIGIPLEIWEKWCMIAVLDGQDPDEAMTNFLVNLITAAVCDFVGEEYEVREAP